MILFKAKKYKLLSDLELLGVLKSNYDATAFGEIYIRFAHLVMGTCLKYLRDEAEAQDLTSKIFEELMAKISKHEISNFKAWLHQVVKNECLMHLRKNKHLFVRSEIVEKEEENDLIYKEQKISLLEEAILSLNHVQKECIHLFYLEDKSYVEISTRLAIDLNKVKSYIQNGKRNLKNILSQHEEFKL